MSDKFVVVFFLVMGSFIGLLLFNLGFYGVPNEQVDVCHELGYEKAVEDWPYYDCVTHGVVLEKAVYCEQDNLDSVIRLFTLRKVEKKCVKTLLR